MIELDRESLLVHVRASDRLDEIEATLTHENLTLALWNGAPMPIAVGAWLEAGAEGARSPWLDPADHLVAGFTAHKKDAQSFTVRPAPRRAVGPDLLSLVLGMRGRMLTLESVWLRVHRVGITRPVTPFEESATETLTADEETLIQAIIAALG
jgi:alkyldihydroxyacetonephosphate synthase